MINIISTQSEAAGYGGPKKVFLNLVQGLEKIGYPYVLNRTMNASKRLWIHDNVEALRFMHRSSAYKIVGPNLVVLPDELPPKVRFENTIYLHPCDWPIRQWEKAGFSFCPLRAWPVGVDTENFRPFSDSIQGKKALVYHKLRDRNELPVIFNALNELGVDHRLLTYGQYSEVEYPAILADTSFIIWHGCHESQGIALQEALACNIPMLVCDATSVKQSTGSYRFPEQYHDFPLTSVPYFDERCGVRIIDLSTLKPALESFLDKLRSFRPRDYILENLTLEKQAHAFVALWETWGLTETEGKEEHAKSGRQFSFPFMYRAGKFAGKVRRQLFL
jgi:hypothetical protein